MWFTVANTLTRANGEGAGRISFGVEHHDPQLTRRLRQVETLLSNVGT